MKNYLGSFVPSFLRSFVPSFLRSFVPSFLRSFVPSFLRYSIIILTVISSMSINVSGQDKPIRLGVFGVGPDDSYLFYYGYHPDPSFSENLWNERDRFKFSLKFVPFKYELPDDWINYNDSQTHIFEGRAKQNNFEDLVLYEGVGSTFGKHDWDLAAWYNLNKTSGRKIPSLYVRNFDWVSFYTGAYNTVWTMQDAKLLQNELYNYRIKKGETAGSFVELGSEVFLTNTDNDNVVVAGTIMYGPSADDGEQLTLPERGYYQETRHRGSQNRYTPHIQRYRVTFTVRVTSISAIPNLLARLKVIVYAKDQNNEINILPPATEASQNIFHNQFTSLGDHNFTLEYDLGGYRSNIFRNSTEDIPIYLSTSFEVESTGLAQFLIKQIEVSDAEVWEGHLSTIPKKNEAHVNLNDHLVLLKDQSITHPNFFNKVFYLQSVDEPHTTDLYNALKFTRETLEQSPLSHKPKLYTHYYPEYNGMRGNENAFLQYFKVVKPDPIVFYSYYHTGDAPHISMFWKVYTFNQYLSQMKDYYPDSTRFHYIVNVWSESVLGWRMPFESELNSTIFTALAFGANTILYEPVYSYADVSSLVNQNGIISPLGEFIADDLNARLQGLIGQKLNNSKYTGNTLVKVNFNGPYGSRPNYFHPNSGMYPQPNAGSPSDYIELLGLDISPYILLAGLFEDWQYPMVKYILLNNVAGFQINSQEPHIKLKKIHPTFNNYSLYDVENPQQWTNFAITNEHFPSCAALPDGEAILYGYGPTAMLGGELTTSETINIPATLFFKDLVIPNGVTLNINQNYTIKKDIFINESGQLYFSNNGLVFPAPGIKITSLNWQSALFKSAYNEKVKLIWSAYPGTIPEQYAIFRKKGNNRYEVIAMVPSSSQEFVDSETDVISGGAQSNEELVHYFIKAILGSGDSGSSNTVIFRTAGEGLEKESTESGRKKLTYSLSQNYPNPFNGRTKINFAIEKQGLITLRVYDILGGMRAELVNGYYEPGEYSVDLLTDDLSSGVYFYELRNDNLQHIVKKLILTR